MPACRACRCSTRRPAEARQDGKLVTISASKWLDQNRAVEQMTWCPGLPMLILDRLVVDGGWIEREDVTCFNLYRPPRIELGDATKAGAVDRPRPQGIRPPDDADAYHPLAGSPRAAPEREDQPRAGAGRSAGHRQGHACSSRSSTRSGRGISTKCRRHICSAISTATSNRSILRINEARDLGEVNRFDFYDHTKIYTAAPPDVLRVDEKYLREYYVFNVLGFIITTNHKTDGIYLPADDRRHYVAWSNHTKEEFSQEYWNELWGWYHAGGFEHVAAYLTELDLSAFDPKAPPPKTPAFWDIVNANRGARGCRAGRRARRAGQPRRRDAEAADREGDGRYCGMADGPQEPARHSASAGALRLYAAPQPQCQGRLLEDRRYTTAGLRQVRTAGGRKAQGSDRAHQRERGIACAISASRGPRGARQSRHPRSSNCPRREAPTTALDHPARGAAGVRGAGDPERLALGRERAARPAQDLTW